MLLFKWSVAERTCCTATSLRVQPVDFIPWGFGLIAIICLAKYFRKAPLNSLMVGELKVTL